MKNTFLNKKIIFGLTLAFLYIIFVIIVYINVSADECGDMGCSRFWFLFFGSWPTSLIIFYIPKLTQSFLILLGIFNYFFIGYIIGALISFVDNKIKKM